MRYLRGRLREAFFARCLHGADADEEDEDAEEDELEDEDSKACACRRFLEAALVSLSSAFFSKVPSRGNRLMRLNVLLGHMSSYEFIDIARLWPRRLRDVHQGNVVRPTRLSRAAEFGSVEVACLYSFLPMLYPKLFKVFKAMQELTVAQSIS